MTSMLTNNILDASQDDKEYAAFIVLRKVLQALPSDADATAAHCGIYVTFNPQPEWDYEIVADTIDRMLPEFDSGAPLFNGSGLIEQLPTGEWTIRISCDTDWPTQYADEHPQAAGAVCHYVSDVLKRCFKDMALRYFMALQQ